MTIKETKKTVNSACYQYRIVNTRTGWSKKVDYARNAEWADIRRRVMERS